MTRAPSDRRTLVSLAVQTTIDAFVYSTYLARLPDIRSHAGIDLAVLGAIMTTGNIAGLVGSLVTPWFLARFGSKAVLRISGPIYVLALPVIGTSRSPALLVTAIVGMMVANAVVDMALAMQSSAFSMSRARPVMSRLSGLYSLGTLGGGLLAAGILAAGVDVTVHLVVLAAALVAALTLVAPGLLPTDTATQPPGAAARRVRLRPVDVVGPALLLAVAAAMIVPLDVVPGEWATFRMIDDLHATRAAAAFAYFAVTAGMTSGRFAGDHVTAWFGRTSVFRTGTLVSVAGLVLGASLPRGNLAPVGFFVAGLGASVLSPLLTEAAGRTPGRPGGGFRALFIGNRLAGLLVPLVVGAIAGLPAVSVGVTMVIVVLPCAVAALLISRRAVREPGAPATPARLAP